MSKKLILLSLLGSFIFPLSVYAHNHQKLEDPEAKDLKCNKRSIRNSLTKNQLKNKRSMKSLSTLKKTEKNLSSTKARRNINKKSFLSAGRQLKDNKNLTRGIFRNTLDPKKKIEVLKAKNTVYKKKLPLQSQTILDLKKEANNPKTQHNQSKDNSSSTKQSISSSQAFPTFDQEIIKKSPISSFKVQKQRTEIKELLEEMSTVLSRSPEQFEDYISTQFDNLVEKIENSPEYAANPKAFNKCHNNIQKIFKNLEDLDFSEVSNRNIHQASKLLSHLMQNLKQVKNLYKDGRYSHYVDFLIKIGEKAQSLLQNKPAQLFQNGEDIDAYSALIQEILSSLTLEDIVKM